MSGQQEMTVSEFTKLAMICAEEEGEELCESGVRRFAEQLAERGVLAEDEKPKPRRVEVDGVELSLDSRGDLCANARGKCIYVATANGGEIQHAPALARALALWCGEEQASPPEGGVMLRLSREEAEAASIVLSRVRPSTDRGKAALRAIEKLDKLIGEVEDDGLSLNIEGD